MSRHRSALDELATIQPHIYKAAMPGYTSNFSRDSLTYGLLADDMEALSAQVEYSASLQGKRADPLTGEEPGKIHHEFPGVEIRGRFTTYNGCDTTALFLLAIARLYQRGNENVLTMYKKHIESAVVYITAHLRGNIFYEDMQQCGTDRFALKVTYWKDSELNTVNKEPAYPITYSLVHFINKEALQEIGEITSNTAWCDPKF